MFQLKLFDFFLRQGLSFREYNESFNSPNQCNFLQFFKIISNNSNDIKSVVLNNALKNNKLTSPEIQKDIVRACAIEFSNSIASVLGDSCFSIWLMNHEMCHIKNK